ncbi:hypothetical protein LUCX_6 [Xanthomonas phage vB_XciM_LucasX]|nr:hypothetical protein LUCX_6 [Xanthomonas phage vB_XciM_LucasX]
MRPNLQDEVESSAALLDSLESYNETLLQDLQEQVSMESHPPKIEYLRQRELKDIEQRLGMEGLDMQGVKDLFSAIGRGANALGHGFMKFLDAIHRLVDTTHLVRARQLKESFKAISKEEAAIQKGRMERPKIAAALAVGGEVSGLLGQAKGLVDFSRRTTTNVLPELASVSRRVAAQINAKRWMGNDAFNAEVIELANILGTGKLPMERYPDKDFQKLWPGNRTIFRTIKPKRPRKEPNTNSVTARKVVQAVSTTSVGINVKSDVVKGKADSILPVLTPAEAIQLIEAAEALLHETIRVKDVAKGYAKDKVPSMISMMISGFFHQAGRVYDDMFTAQDDGYHVVDMSGGKATRHEVGTRNTLGSVGALADGVRKGAKVGLLSLEEDTVSMEDDKDELRVQLASWVSRYLKLSLIDHHKTSRALLLLLVAVARSYLDYAEESLDYYR